MRSWSACATTASCGSSSAPKAASSSTSEDVRGQTITLVTHDSFAVSDAVLAAFEQRTGIDVQAARGGDAGQVLNQAILTKGSPIGDVLFGVDNTLLGRALDAGIFEPYASPLLSTLDPALDLDKDQHRVTPIDESDVCVNYDAKYFATKKGEVTRKYRRTITKRDVDRAKPPVALTVAHLAGRRPRRGEAGVAEPGGVSWMLRHSSPITLSTSTLKPSLST